MMGLNTWARPEAIMDVRVCAQVNVDYGLLDLNPPGRRYADKWRPVIRLTDNLRCWLEHWGQDAPMMWNGLPIQSVKQTGQRHAFSCGLPAFTRCTIRLFIADDGPAGQAARFRRGALAMAGPCRRAGEPDDPDTRSSTRNTWPIALAAGMDDRRTAGSHAPDAGRAQTPRPRGRCPASYPLKPLKITDNGGRDRD